MTDTATRPVIGPPEVRGGWWHQYVCPAHGVELDHGDLLTSTFPAVGAACRYGCTIDTPDVRGAWYVLSHQAWARRIRVLAHTGRRSEAVGLLTGYARIHRELTGAGEHEDAEGWMLCGRLFHQALTEAIWAVSIGHAAWTLAAQDRAGLEPLLGLLDALADAAVRSRDVLVEQGKFTSNYTTWLTAAGVVTSRAAALIRGVDPTGPDHWLHGELGLFAQVPAATLDDGWQWEVSTYYHGFVLRAALLALRGTDPRSWPPAFATRLRAMVQVLADLATADGRLPALHDGPYTRPALDLEWLELVALAGQACADPGLSAVATAARAGAGIDDDGLDGASAGWFTGRPLAAVEPVRPVVVHPDAGYAVLRAEGVHAVLAFGPPGGSHVHRDALALSLYGAGTPWQPDPGQVPYGHRGLRAHYAATAAHPTFSVDSAEQGLASGVLVRSVADGVVAAVTDTYPDVRASRGLRCGPGYVIDVVRIAADRPRDLTVALRPDCDLSVHTDGARFRSTWSGAAVLHGRHLCTEPSAPVVRVGPGPADDPQRVRHHVDWTARATRATFCSVFWTAPAVVDAVELVAGALVVTARGAAIRYDLEDLC